MWEKWMKKCLVFTLVLLQTMPLLGCYDSKELDEKTFLTMIGVDVGTEHPLKLSLQFEKLTEQDKSSNDTEDKSTSNTEVVSEEVDTIFTGQGLLTIATSRQYENAHTKIVVFSEEVARSKQFQQYVSSIYRNHSVRGISYIMITKGKAEDFLKEDQLMTNTYTAKAVEILMRQTNYNAYFPRVTIDNAYNEMKSSKRKVIIPLAAVNKQVEDSETETEEGKNETTKDASKQKNGEKQPSEEKSTEDDAYKAGELPRSGGLAREVFGSAVLEGTKMIGELTGEETRILLMVRDEFKKADFSSKDPLKKNQMISLTVERARAPEIKVETKGERPVIHVRISLDGDVDSIFSTIDYERPQMKKILEEAFEDDIKTHLDALIEKCQKEFKSDVFGFGRAAVMHFLTIDEWEKYNWRKAFPEAKVITEVSFAIRRTGTLMKAEKLRPVVGDDEDDE
jgi:spore germination protein KC